MKKENKREEGKKSFRAYVISTVILVAAVVLCAVIAIQILANGYVSFFGFLLTGAVDLC